MMQTVTPKVSIVLPCYNGGKMLGGAIESVLNQIFNDWELIIVNDCSTDNTLEVANRYAAKDERIRVFSNEVNSKLPKTLNNGFRQARGEYWTWTSDDNLLLPDFLEEMVKYLDEHTEVGFVVGGEKIINENNEIISTNIPPENIQFIIPLNNYVGACFMYRQKIALQAGEYNEDLFLVEDYEYWIRLSGLTKMGVLKECLYLYRKHNQSLTATRSNDIKEKLVRLRLMYKEQIEKMLTEHKDLLALFYYRIVDNLVGKEKIKYIFQFIRKNPYYFGIRYFFIHLPHKLIQNPK